MQHNYRPGFEMHFIQARLVRESPWGWRDGIVADALDGTHVIDYIRDDGRVIVWSDRLGTAPLGTVVRVHERFHVLDVDGRWFNVRIVARGLGPVPEPADKSAWPPQGFGVVNLATGVGVGTPPPAEPSLR